MLRLIHYHFLALPSREHVSCDHVGSIFVESRCHAALARILGICKGMG